MKKRLVSKARMAAIAGVSAPAITKACNASLAPAFDGKKVNLDHPATVKYLEGKTTAKALDTIPRDIKPKTKRPPSKGTKPKDNPINVPENIEEYLDMTMRELVTRFGTEEQFESWLKATKTIEDINEKRLKNLATKRVLISLELVKEQVIAPFNSTNLRLMKDGAKSITSAVISKHLSGTDVSAIEAHVSDLLGSFITPTKAKIARALKSIKGIS